MLFPSRGGRAGYTEVSSSTLTSPMSIPSTPHRDDGSPPPPRGECHQMTLPSTPGGTDTTQQSPEFYYTQRKKIFGAISACDFLLISYCSWAK